MQAELKNLIALSVMGGAAVFLCPTGCVRRVMGLLFTALLIGAALGPLRGLDADVLGFAQARLDSAEAEILQSGGESESLLKRLLLQKNCAGYIEARSSELGLETTDVTVTLCRDEGGVWLPYAVSVHAAGRAEAAEQICALIRDELGIPPERQVWTLNE